MFRQHKSCCTILSPTKERKNTLIVKITKKIVHLEERKNMDRFSSFQLLNFLCVFPLVFMVIKQEKIVLVQPHETATAEACVFKDLFVSNKSSAKIRCGAECNKLRSGRCYFVDVINGNPPLCRLITGFKTPKNVSSGHLSDQYVRYKKVLILCSIHINIFFSVTAIVNCLEFYNALN